MVALKLLPRLVLSAVGFLGLSNFAAAVPGGTVDSKILIFARDAYSASTASSGLEGYGIPYETVLVPQAGITLPALTSSATQGRYAGIIIMGAVSYDYSGTWRSALTDAQMTTIHTYQTNFHVRMARIDEYPGPAFGKLSSHIRQRRPNRYISRVQANTISGASAVNGGCCNTGIEQLVSFSNTSAFPTANVKTYVSSVER